MAHNLFLLRAFFLLCFVVLNASSYSQEDYWKMKLPKVPIPKAVGDNLVHSDENGKPTTNQPITVSRWKYKEDGEKQKAKENPPTNQPYIAFWKYKEDKEKEIKEKPTTNLRYIDFWKYKEDKEKEIKEKPTTNLRYIDFWKYKEDKEKEIKEKPTTNQLYIDFWKYKEDKEKPTTNQPYIVFWKYKEDKEKEIKEKPMTNQPYIDFWKYKEDDTNTNNHKLHDHFMHQDMGSVDDNNNFLTSNEENLDKDMTGGSIFFVEEKLHVGMKQRHDFQKIEKVRFMPKDMVDKIPFEVDRLPQILNSLSINPNSLEATSMKETLTACLERPTVKKENRTCAQSLEDIVDFVIRELGSDNVKVRTMNMSENEVPTGMHEYEITKIEELDVPGKNGVACHKMAYPYAVYWCHHQQDIGQYKVTLVNPEGVKVETTAVCHYDTYAWNPDVPALQYLKIRPGDAPVCHFSGINDMFWSLNTALQGKAGKSGNRKFDLAE